MRKIIIMIVLLLGISGCAHNKIVNTGSYELEIDNSVEKNGTSFHALIYVGNEQIPEKDLPGKIKDDLLNSYRWIWFQNKIPPNACYIVELGIDETGEKETLIGLAVLKIQDNTITGTLLQWPDAGMLIDIEMHGDNNLTGNTRFWGGPEINHHDKDGRKVEQKNSDRITPIHGKYKMIPTIYECFYVMKNRLK